jgi:hypothetical protein
MLFNIVSRAELLLVLALAALAQRAVLAQGACVDRGATGRALRSLSSRTIQRGNTITKQTLKT